MNRLYGDFGLEEDCGDPGSGSLLLRWSGSGKVCIQWSRGQCARDSAQQIEDSK